MSKRSWGTHYYFMYKHFGDVHSLSRKTKKAVIGKKMSKVKLRKRLKAVVVTQSQEYQGKILSDRFCPKCGCDQCKSTGNMAEYPEIWEQEHCMRCGFLVSQADNSPYYHALEFPEYNYEIN